MKHDYDWHTDANGAYQKCRRCGKIKSGPSSLDWMIKDECEGRIDWQSFDGIQRLGNATISYTIVSGGGGGSGRRIPPEERDQLHKGDDLLKRWTDEDDEQE